MRVLLIVALAAALGQAQPPSITGLAVRTTNEEPIGDARIMLMKVGGGVSDVIVLTTDDRGRFGAAGVSPGTYRVFAAREDYIRTESPAVTVASGQQVGSVVVRMTPTGVITGRVVDEHGDPVARVYVRAVAKNLTRETPTNDLGDYRIYDLPAGSYLISAAPYTPPRIENGRYVIPGPPSPYAPGEGQSMRGLAGLLQTGEFIHPMALTGQTYVRVYYPGTTDASEARPLDLQPGAVLSGIDLTTR